MKDLKLSIDIDRSAKDISAYTLNPENTPKWIDSILEQVTNELPPKLGTIYRNRGDNGAPWSELKITEYAQDKSFTFSKTDGSYTVRYILKPQSPNSTTLEYHEWTDKDELEVPFSMKYLQKLKKILESK